VEHIQNCPRIVRVLCVIRQSIEAAFAQAGSCKFLGYKVQDVGRHSGCVTPAVSLVGVPCCDATMIWAAANGATALAFAGKGLVPRRGWLVQHMVLSRWAAAGPHSLSREPTRVRDAGKKIPRPLTREWRRASKHCANQLVSSPIQSLARLSAADYASADLMSVK
jgi:hypothetical protein